MHRDRLDKVKLMVERAREIIEQMISRCRYRDTKRGCDGCFHTDRQVGGCAAVKALEPKPVGKPNEIWENGGSLKETSK